MVKTQYKLQYAAAVTNAIHYPGNNTSYNYNSAYEEIKH